MATITTTTISRAVKAEGEAVALQDFSSTSADQTNERNTAYRQTHVFAEPDVQEDVDPVAEEDASGAEPASGPSDLDTRGTILLAVQHASSSWGYRSAEFAYPLYMVQLFTNTLLPASIYGLVTTAGAILFSNSVGRAIDRYSHQKLRTLRVFIVTQKLLVAASYALFLILFSSSSMQKEAEGGAKHNARPWVLFTALTALGIGVVLSNVGISVGVEREWVTIISEGSSARLTRLNAIMRRIDLISKLASPLFVSALTTAISYRTSAIVLMAVCGLSAVFELLFIGIVYRRFPSLAQDEAMALQRLARSQASVQQQAQSNSSTSGWSLQRLLVTGINHAKKDVMQQCRDWSLFVRLPVFLTALCISLLYMSVLSFDPTFIAYLKSETLYSDPFIAGMRAVGVVAGLVGTLIMPILEKKTGLVRTGSYSLLAELIPLIPAVVALWITGFSTNSRFGLDAKQRPSWNTGLLFSGLAISRIGLWSFDLTQLAMMQTALSPQQLGPDVDRKNALMALQYSLQNIFDLGHYGLTLGWNKPAQFKYAATVSLVAVAAATVIYIVGYARRVRGHIVHLDGLQRLLSRKER